MMTTCNDIDLIGYIEGIDPDGKVKQHLNRCPGCRKELAVYQTLLKGMAAGNTSEPAACPHRTQTIDAAMGETDIPGPHLETCNACRDLFERVSRAAGDIDWNIDMGQAPPKWLEAQVAFRKKKWLKGQPESAGDLIDFPEEKDRKKRIRELLDQDDTDLPKAAFPDDLAGDADDDDKET